MLYAAFVHKNLVSTKKELFYVLKLYERLLAENFHCAKGLFTFAKASY